MVGSRVTFFALLLTAVSTGVRADDDPRAQADTLLRHIARAGADAQPLDRTRVETLFGLRTEEECGDFSDPQGHIYWCKDTPAETQTGPIRFVAYEISRLGPGVMSGGQVSLGGRPGALVPGRGRDPAGPGRQGRAGASARHA
jgi:hypothetical protein